MGRLYDDCVRLQAFIEHEDLDVFRARGQLAMKCGFIITMVSPDAPDDPAKIEALEQAAAEMFGITL